MEVGPGQVRIGDRTFRVFGKAIHPEWFSVRVYERFALGPWEADVRIVEGGHVVAFSAGGTTVAEVLGAREAPLPVGGLLLDSPVDGERSEAVRAGRNVAYQACHEVERVDREVFQHLCDEARLDASPSRLFHVFGPVHRFATRPLSLVRVERLPRGVSIQTFHSFPEERAVLRSQSLFELDPG
jgi:hypothetical protein